MYAAVTTSCIFYGWPYHWEINITDIDTKCIFVHGRDGRRHGMSSMVESTYGHMHGKDGMVWNMDCMVRKDGHIMMDVRYARDQDGNGSGPPSGILATAPRSTESSSASFNYWLTSKLLERVLNLTNLFSGGHDSTIQETWFFIFKKPFPQTRFWKDIHPRLGLSCWPYENKLKELNRIATGVHNSLSKSYQVQFP